MKKLGFHHLVPAYLVILAFTCTGALYLSSRSISEDLYPRFEMLEITDINETNNMNSTWTIAITLENWGSADTTINNILLCGKSYREYKNSTQQQAVVITNPDNFAAYGLFIKSGEKKTLELNIQEVSPFSSGFKIDFLLHSLVDQEYPGIVNLPYNS